MKHFKFITAIFLLLSSLAWADRVRLLDDAKEAFEIRMALMDSAQKEIQMSYFIFGDDASAMEVLAMLRKKAREGVKVKVIIDDLFNHIPLDIGVHLAQNQVEIKNFNKFNLMRLRKTIRYRMHDKMLIVDRDKVILGGRNIEDTYYGRGGKNYDDRDIYLQGDVAQNSADYFDQLWQAEHLTPMKTVTVKDNGPESKLDQHLKHFEQSGFAKFNLEAWEEQTTEVAVAHLLKDDITPRKKKMTGTVSELYALIANAKESVLIESPYLVFTKELKQVVKEAVARGVKIRIMTNSLKSTDALLPQAGYIGQRKKIVRMGIELYEYFGEESFHAKSLVVDGRIAVVGSFNFDPRSQNLNTETMALIEDEKIASDLISSMEENLKLAYKIDDRGRPVGHDSRLPGANFKKRLKTRLIQVILIPFIRGLL